MLTWYTQENGRLCLGTGESKFANFHVATDVVLTEQLEAPLNHEHIDVIGCFPEDWYSDSEIETKINRTARHFFEAARRTTSVML